MKVSKQIMILGLLIMAFTTMGCGLVDDAVDQVDIWINGEEKEEDGPKRPYQYIPAIAVGEQAAVIDPFDGNIELIDPNTKVRRTIRTSLDTKTMVPAQNGTKIVSLDHYLDLVRIIDVESRETEHIIHVGETVNRLIPSPFGNQVLAIYDPDLGDVGFGDSGTINYFELDIIDTSAGTFKSLSIDFAPNRIAFAPDGLNVLLSKDIRLIQLDMASGQYVSFPLTLQPDDTISPRAIAISPDSEFALILVNGSSDVYVIDLVAQYINIIDLTGEPVDVLFVPDTAQPERRIALLPLGPTGQVALVDLDEAVPEILEVEKVVNSGVISPDGMRALFFESGGHSIISMDLESFDHRIYPLNISIDFDERKPVRFSPDSKKAIVIGEPGYGTYGSWDVDVLDFANHNVAPVGFESEITDMEFSTNAPTVGVLLGGAKKFVVLDLDTLVARARPTRAQSRNVEYLPGANAYVIDFKMRKGMLLFVGDQGSDLFWIAARYHSI